jgi:hypothetical protein
MEVLNAKRFLLAQSFQKDFGVADSGQDGNLF